MIPKKGVVILVALAVILASVAIGMEVMDSDEVPTNSNSVNAEPSCNGGQIGVTIEPGVIDDKGASQ